MEFGSTNFREPSLVWYFRKHVDGFHTNLDDAIRAAVSRATRRTLRHRPDALATKLYPSLPPGWKSYTAQGINTANGKRVDLTLILKPS